MPRQQLWMVQKERLPGAVLIAYERLVRSVLQGSCRLAGLMSNCPGLKNACNQRTCDEQKRDALNPVGKGHNEIPSTFEEASRDAGPGRQNSAGALPIN